MPEVTDILTEHGSLLPYRSRISYHIEDWSDKRKMISQSVWKSFAARNRLPNFITSPYLKAR